MLAGDTRQRNFTWPEPDPPKPWSGDQASQFALSQKAIGFNCLDYSHNPESTLYRHRMPEKEYLDAHCKDGIRIELMFPSCWNGKDTDSANHKDHMAYPSLTIDGDCPKGFEQRVPSLLYETIWNTYAFKDQEGEFALANGDTTGCGYHGDFITGWDVGFLQNAVNTCTNLSGNIGDCPIFTLQSETEAAKCKMDMPKMLNDDDCKGPRQGLPGNVAVQAGPEYATMNSGNKPVSLYTPPAINTKAPVPSFQQATTALTDAYGGGISVAAVNHAVSNPVPSPVVTPAPVAPVAPVGPVGGAGAPRILSTSTYTSAAAVYEIVYEEVDITVTANAPAPSAPKHVAPRHNHNHHRRDGHF
ncbi:hypothetical protein EJ05DRAFT_479101 [Pseudovirgaria hyperparasitica]|uniref:DUF1996 domain-containing protein n=1 Tax=Pseudovirgaria hyperparasitica TaxID=470096 RepID=A0A6A6VWS0_9PEZI|nr:uncharacterized protein EJ05DRAFT_479101 [Pseudovirgaria hyperparasitica]KAF2754663.1 hypothetical protein EJ05DRAFT_479101 [Pseudovirgaria hyperparasitica]